MKIRNLCSSCCLAFVFAFATSVHAATYLESGGKVVIEVESADQTNGWSRENKISGAKGGAYLVWAGANYFNSSNAGRGTLRYSFRISEAGNYELRWRSYITEGTNATEANDSWVRFATGRNISGQHALNGWTKSYMNQLDQWSWSAKTVDNVGKPIRQFFSAGDHVIEISGRSRGHAIDRLVMFRYDNIKYSQSTFDGFPVSSIVGGSELPNPTPLELSSPPPSGSCEAGGSKLSTAIQAYAVNCPGIPRKDCDPAANGWVCSSNLISNNGPGGINPPKTTEPPTPPTPELPTSLPSGSCEASGSNLRAAIQAYAANCPGVPRKDCDPAANGWTCSSIVIGNNGTGGNNPPTPELPTPPTPAPDPDAERSIGKVRAGDLVALHYDNCPDRDDGHALPAGKAVVIRSGLSNVIVVNGTCGDNIRNSYQPGSEAVASAVWGSQWLDYHNSGQATVRAATQRWAQVLSNGGDVWVAEGGPSDFTASVLDSLDRQYPSLNLKKVHVVQHAAGSRAFNEANSARIGIVKRLADYRAIPNGNVGGNGSANLNTKSTFFVSVARQSEFASEWNVAFNYLDPNRRLDFSDTVELLYLINDTTTNNVDDFARKYLR